MPQLTREKKDTEEIIKLAAQKVFFKKGLDGAKLQEIADEAGISRTSLHYYYKNKENLYSAVFTDKLLDLKIRLGSTVHKNLPLKEKLIEFTREYFALAVEDPEFDLFILNEFCTQPEKMLKIVNAHSFSNMVMQDIEKLIKKGQINGQAKQHFITFISVVFFPFAAKSMIQHMLKCADDDYIHFLREREQYIINFIQHYFKSTF